MKKLLPSLLAIGMVLSITACGSSNTDVSSVEPDEPVIIDEPAEIEEPAEEPFSDDTVSDDTVSQDVDCIADFDAAQDIWMGFESGFQNDYNDVTVINISGNDYDYYRVTEPGLESLDDLKNYLAAYVDYSYAEELVDSSDMYQEVDGALYVYPAGRGDDLSIGWVEYETEPDKLIVKIHRLEYFDKLNDWYENGVIDSYEFPFTVADGHAVFESMFYLCGSSPIQESDPAHDGDALEAAMIGLLVGKWVSNDGFYYEITDDGSFTYCSDTDEVINTGSVFSSRNEDYSYMLEGEDVRSTLFILSEDQQGFPVLEFENGALVYFKEGEG